MPSLFNMNVYVVTNIEHGWDCVEKVFSTDQKALDWITEYCKDCNYPEDIFMIHEKVLDED
ncbi:hypothetical protein EKK58_10340 [Candidatus Dependentiae bacterium]|nr:MAG: hypothetical protein EKK58_10340 [Candidatus Dependentiae bacterium]